MEKNPPKPQATETKQKQKKMGYIKLRIFDTAEWRDIQYSDKNISKT